MARRACFALVLAAAAFVARAQQPTAWYSDIDAALAEASKTYQQIVIEVNDARGREGYSLQWRKALKDAAVVAALEPYLRARLDADSGGRAAEFLKGYQVNYFPSILIVDCKGGEVALMPVTDSFYGPELAKTLEEQLVFYSGMNGAIREDWIETGVQWLYDVDEALKRAKELDRKIYAYVVLNYCHAVVEMNRDTFALPRISDFLNENFVCLKVDLMDLGKEGRAGEFFGKYGLDSAPTNIFLDKGGKKLGLEVGYLSARDFKRLADRALNK